MLDPLTLASQRLKYDKKTGYYLDYYKPSLDVQGKNYGEIDQPIDIFCRKYNSTSESMGVMRA